MIKKPAHAPYEAQEPHTKEDCKINEAPHNSPEVDCGHSVDGPGPGTYSEFVNEGPGVQLAKDKVTGPGVQIDKDKVTGPGV